MQNTTIGQSSRCPELDPLHFSVAESSTGNVSVIISPNDYAYRPPGAAIPGINVSTSAAASNYVPFFLCAVANADATENVTFALQKYAYLPTGQIVTPEAAAMTSIFNR